MQIADERGWAVVRVWGDLDLASAPRVRAACIEAVHRAAGSLGSSGTAGGATTPADARAVAGVAVDLVGVDLLDSTGLGVLIGALRRARERGLGFALVQPPQPITALLHLVGLDAVFAVVATTAELGRRPSDAGQSDVGQSDAGQSETGAREVAS